MSLLVCAIMGVTTRLTESNNLQKTLSSAKNTHRCECIIIVSKMQNETSAKYFVQDDSLPLIHQPITWCSNWYQVICQFCKIFLIENFSCLLYLFSNLIKHYITEIYSIFITLDYISQHLWIWYIVRNDAYSHVITSVHL